MQSSQHYIHILRQREADLRSRFGITSMRLFGSVARGDAREGSDVDLFVSMPPHFYTHIAAAQYIEDLLGCGVDLVADHKNMRPFFRKQIEKDGIQVFPAT
ncbi:MAG: nucleotidyltransferase family protein [Bacteroidaceae bacterium]|nr:nucleotidyltransferase family protein [Bacteroidaceae bacterium]